LIPFFFITIPSRKRRHAPRFADFFIQQSGAEVNCESASTPTGQERVSFKIFVSVLRPSNQAFRAMQRNEFHPIVAGLTQFYRSVTDHADKQASRRTGAGPLAQARGHFSSIIQCFAYLTWTVFRDLIGSRE
jgi:hypothetical protein